MVTLLEEPRTKTQRPQTLRPIEFELPSSLEAHEPPEARGLERDDVRLLVSSRQDDRVVHTTFRALPDFLSPGDLLVVNDSATIPAALPAIREDGSQFALHLSNRLDDGTWVVEPRKTEVRPGERVALPGGAWAQFDRLYKNSRRLWMATLELGIEGGGVGGAYGYLARHGEPIRYPYVPNEWPLPLYQTVYARYPGSAEMPSAGRPFTWRMIWDLERKGIGWATLTLHAGVASLEAHEAPYEEWYELPMETAAAVSATRAAGGRVVAVGTTVVRALESAADEAGVVGPANGWTDLVITPERGVRVVDGLLTGFHEPSASHLAMLEALASRQHLKRGYQAAIENGYLWHEFGDVHLIL